MNEHEQIISDAARAMGRKGGLVRNPNKGFGSGDNAVKAAKARWEGKMSNDNDDGSFVLRDSVPEGRVEDDSAPVMEENADQYSVEFGERLRSLRVSNSESRRDIAEKLGVSVACLINWEKGISEPTASKIVTLCNIFDVSGNYLLFGGDDRAPSMHLSPVQPEQTVQPSEPESPSVPEQQTQPPMPMCKDCPLMSTVKSISEIALALSRR